MKGGEYYERLRGPVAKVLYHSGCAFQGDAQDLGCASTLPLYEAKRTGDFLLMVLLGIDNEKKM